MKIRLDSYDDLPLKKYKENIMLFCFKYTV